MNTKRGAAGKCAVWTGHAINWTTQYITGSGWSNQQYERLTSSRNLTADLNICIGRILFVGAVSLLSNNRNISHNL